METTKLLDAVKTQYRAEIGEQKLLGNSANIIYEISLQDKPAVLRLSKHSIHKELHIAFELAWMNELVRHMSGIASPIPSLNGNLYETASADGEQWIISVFQKAPGHIIDPENPLEWNDTLFSSLGGLMGKMHKYTRPYARKIGINKQLDWQHSFLFWPENNVWIDPDIQPVWEQTLSEMRALPVLPEDYGIVHGDIHHLNFHVKDDNIVLFDFDDCEYNWYAYDIASTLFFMASTADYKNAESGKHMLERVAVPFLCGYQKQAHLPAHWYNMFPLFFRYRRLAQYKFVTNLFYGRENPHEDYLTWSKNEILSGGQYQAYNFNSLNKHQVTGSKRTGVKTTMWR